MIRQPFEGDKQSWTIEIPLEIPSQNTTSKGKHWRARVARTRATRSKWRQYAALAMRMVQCPVATGPRAIHIVAYRKQRCADIANLIGGAKACIDGLCDAGLLLDDRDQLASITYEQHARSKHPRKTVGTIITITEGNP